ncbi:6380_t:CDS:2 [Ambispora gerdemannii]|uniref:6380_t:CDS:1 n=1 Tax=Ambispora gerdemannii TaxID=144530 RepID=A0A9N8V3E1_9GLOM|nr:6380_t:CDS:2 [Ambispora gerdemannii]
MSPTVGPLGRLRIALLNLSKIPPTKIKSPSTQPRRASVSIIIHARQTNTSVMTDLEQFWELPWVQKGVPEILYIKRALREGDRWSGQMAFPGGKQDPVDVDDLDTAERETFEEVGLDLGNPEQFYCVGALDDREVTTTFGKKLLMILCPFVFLQTTPEPLQIEISGSEVASTHWVPLAYFFDEKITRTWDPISVDISSRLAPNSWVLQRMLQTLTGRLHFHCIKLPSVETIKNQNINNNDDITATATPTPIINSTSQSTEYLQLWGLTLQMTSDLMDMMYLIGEEPPRRLDAIRPKFDYPDVNFFIWCFLRNNRGDYRRKKMELATRRRKWANGWIDYYSAVRKALLIAIFTRTILAFFILSRGSRYLFGKT